MKKIIALSAALAMMCCFAGCGEQSSVADESSVETTAPVVTEATQAETTAAVEGTEAAPEETEQAPSGEGETPAVEGTPATVLKADFLDKMASGTEYTAEKLATELVANPVITFMGATMPVEPGFLNGFTEEINGFKEGCFFGPMIGAIPFAGYVFTLADDADVEAFAANLKDKADMRWNICTEADEMVCETSGNTVFFLMAPVSLDEE